MADVDSAAEVLGLTRSSMVRSMVRAALRARYDSRDGVFFEALDIFGSVVHSAVRQGILDAAVGASLEREIRDARALVGGRINASLLEEVPGVTFNKCGMPRFPESEQSDSEERKQARAAAVLRIMVADADTESLRVFDRYFAGGPLELLPDASGFGPRKGKAEAVSESEPTGLVASLDRVLRPWKCAQSADSADAAESAESAEPVEPVEATDAAESA